MLAGGIRELSCHIIVLGYTGAATRRSSNTDNLFPAPQNSVLSPVQRMLQLESSGRNCAPFWRALPPAQQSISTCPATSALRVCDRTYRNTLAHTQYPQDGTVCRSRSCCMLLVSYP